MPRRRRPARPVRRPNFQPAPEEPTSEESKEEEEPVFADEPAVAMPAGFGGSPVDTRPSRGARDERAQGRRLAQLRRSSGEERGASRSAIGQLPTFERGYINEELRRIMITTVSLTILLIVLAVVLR